MKTTHKSTPTVSAPARSMDRDVTDYGTLAMVGACLAALALLLMPGCSNPGLAHAVDVTSARDALKIALDGWKRGESPQSLASSPTPMIVQDLEWGSGAKLIDYQFVDEGKAYDANLRIQVKLTVSNSQGSGKSMGKTSEKKVWYLVGTSPQVTVFRDMLRR